MDWRQMDSAPDNLETTGNVFSVEQRVTIQAALKVLHQQHKFNQVHFIGKILGTENDYWLVCGIGKDYLADRTYFYSKDLGSDWLPLPKVGDDVIEMALSCRGHFTGDPTADCETDICPDGDEVGEGDDWVTIREEERLAGTILRTMDECAIIPRGALMKNSQGMVFENKMFEGLTKLEAGQFHSYYHVRKPDPNIPWDRSIVNRADYNLSLDFLNSLACDLPAGSWSIQIDKMATLATIRSMYWPGFFGYHELGTQNFGWVFMGTGKKNWDVPFQMSLLPMCKRVDIVEGGDFEMEVMKTNANGEDEVEYDNNGGQE